MLSVLREKPTGFAAYPRKALFEKTDGVSAVLPEYRLSVLLFYFPFPSCGFFDFFAAEKPNVPIFLPRAKYSPCANAARCARDRSSLPFRSSKRSSTSVATTSQRNITCVPSSSARTARHSSASGHSAINGAETALACALVNPHFLNLSTFLPV